MGLGEYGRYATLGISLVVTTAIYLFLGYRGGMWLDRRLGLEPVFLIVGIVLGMVLSLVSFAKELLALTQERRAPAQPDGDNDAGDSEKNNVSAATTPRRRLRSPKGKEEGE